MTKPPTMMDALKNTTRAQQIRFSVAEILRQVTLQKRADRSKTPPDDTVMFFVTAARGASRADRIMIHPLAGSAFVDHNDADRVIREAYDRVSGDRDGALSVMSDDERVLGVALLQSISGMKTSGAVLSDDHSQEDGDEQVGSGVFVFLVDTTQLFFVVPESGIVRSAISSQPFPVPHLRGHTISVSEAADVLQGRGYQMPDSDEREQDMMMMLLLGRLIASEDDLVLYPDRL